jgi:hypothetical protein
MHAPRYVHGIGQTDVEAVADVKNKVAEMGGNVVVLIGGVAEFDSERNQFKWFDYNGSAYKCNQN